MEVFSSVKKKKKKKLWLKSIVRCKMPNGGRQLRRIIEVQRTGCVYVSIR
jgi:DNA mismatch repair ATPase MutS